jgi:hypothetical protein
MKADMIDMKAMKNRGFSLFVTFTGFMNFVGSSLQPQRQFLLRRSE